MNTYSTKIPSQSFKIYLCLCLIISSFSNYVFSQEKTEFDVVISGGRVLDPETGLDQIKNIGILDGIIAEISSNFLLGKNNVDASGLIVSPGFIDLHVHGMTNVEQEYQIHDGVTTALELEGGIPYLSDWYDSRKSKSIINYGASVNWGFSRILAMKKYEDLQDKVAQLTKRTDRISTIYSNAIQNIDETLTPDEIEQMFIKLKDELNAGGIGIGIPIGYYPGAKPEEDFRIYQYAGKEQIPIFSHVRQGGIISVQQAISNAMLTHAPLHIVHMNSMALGDIGIGIEMVQAAQSQGYDITTEMYPYTAASTSLESAIFNDGWQQKLSISYNDLQWVKTGERLTEETFKKYRKEGGTIIIHMMKPKWIKAGLKTSGTIVASDGMPYAKLAHPRTAGTFSRVLGKYVREEKVLDLMGAIKKMTLLPAQRLENIVPVMRFRGRIQVGAIADITIFDSEKIIDKATFENGLAFSEGVQYVLVKGVFVLKEGKTVNNTFPGQPIFGKYKN